MADGVAGVADDSLYAHGETLYRATLRSASYKWRALGRRRSAYGKGLNDRFAPIPISALGRLKHLSSPIAVGHCM